VIIVGLLTQHSTRWDRAVSLLGYTYKFDHKKVNSDKEIDCSGYVSYIVGKKLGSWEHGRAGRKRFHHDAFDARNVSRQHAGRVRQRGQRVGPRAQQRRGPRRDRFGKRRAVVPVRERVSHARRRDTASSESVEKLELHRRKTSIWRLVSGPNPIQDQTILCWGYINGSGIITANRNCTT
jgi:hypothetical protein